MAKDMGGRYLRRMPLLSTRNLFVLGDLLVDAEETISASDLKKFEGSVDAAQKRLQVSDTRRDSFRNSIEEFRVDGRGVAVDVGLAMLSVMMYRYDKRRGQPSMFGPDDDPDVSRPVVANPSVYEAARLRLLHKFERAYFYGIDDLCDASSENAEQFLQLAAILVETAATQVIRSKPALLSADTQHKLLRRRGGELMEWWSFPHYRLVRSMVTSMAEKCVEVTLLPNGWLAPNAFGIRQEEFDNLPSSDPDLARVLQFGVAYNGITLVPHHQTKSKEWCLVELGGMVILKHGLTLKRGGFIESSARELRSLLQETQP